MSEKKARRTQSDNFERANLRALVSQRILRRSPTAVSTTENGGDGVEASNRSVVATPNKIANAASRGNQLKKRSWLFGKSKTTSKSYSMQCDENYGVVLNNISRSCQSQKAAKTTVEKAQAHSEIEGAKHAEISQSQASVAAKQGNTEASESSVAWKNSNNTKQQTTTIISDNNNSAMKEDAKKKSTNNCWTLSDESAHKSRSADKSAENNLCRSDFAVKLMRKIPQVAPPKPPRSPLPKPRKMAPKWASAPRETAANFSQSEHSTSATATLAAARGSLSNNAITDNCEAITRRVSGDDCTRKILRPEFEPRYFYSAQTKPNSFVGVSPVTSPDENVDAWSASFRKSSKSLQQSEKMRQNLQLQDRLFRATISLPSSSLSNVSAIRPTDISISPSQQRQLCIRTSPISPTSYSSSSRFDTTDADADEEGDSNNAVGAVNKSARAMRRETSMPSIMAAAVVGSWRKGNHNNSLKKKNQLLESPEKRLSFTKKETDSCAEDESNNASPSVKFTNDIRGASASDDSLAKDDFLVKDYHLSNLSNDVLMQIIWRFPFTNSPKIKREVSRTASNDFASSRLLSENGATTPPLQYGKVGPGTPDIVESPTATPWRLKKRFFSRQQPATIDAVNENGAERSALNEEQENVKRKVSSSLKLKMPKSDKIKQQLARSDSNTSAANVDVSQKGAKSALGKLCKVSVDTMAITALPLDCWLKERLKNWVQLSGHAGTIVPASNHTLWKKQPNQNTTEAVAYAKIMQDVALVGLTPKFYKEITHNKESFIEIQDLLAQFPNTSSRAIMDIKIGIRTFMESEVLNTTKRTDLYRKMVDIAPDEPTDEEKADEAITKLRYMQFRERESSTASLGFRIEAAQLPGGKLQKSFKKVHTKQQVMETLIHFFGERHAEIRVQLAERLRKMRDGIEKSHFFKTHEVVGSSILIVYDERKCGAWMIDFAKSTTVPDSITLNHRTQWKSGNHEDGYLIGLENLIDILEMAEKESKRIPPLTVLAAVNK